VRRKLKIILNIWNSKEPDMSLPNTDAAAAELKDAVGRAVALIQSLQQQLAAAQDSSAAVVAAQQADDQAAASEIQPSIDALNQAAPPPVQ
jgi:hypothetical protein